MPFFLPNTLTYIKSRRANILPRGATVDTGVAKGVPGVGGRVRNRAWAGSGRGLMKNFTRRRPANSSDTHTRWVVPSPAPTPSRLFEESRQQPYFLSTGESLSWIRAIFFIHHNEKGRAELYSEPSISRIFEWPSSMNHLINCLLLPSRFPHIKYCVVLENGKKDIFPPPPFKVYRVWRGKENYIPLKNILWRRLIRWSFPFIVFTGRCGNGQWRGVDKVDNLLSTIRGMVNRYKSL